MERLIHRLEGATIRVTRVIALIGLAALLILAIITMADVAMRWLFNQPITGVEDLAKLVVAIAIAASIPISANTIISSTNVNPVFLVIYTISVIKVKEHIL